MKFTRYCPTQWIIKLWNPLSKTILTKCSFICNVIKDPWTSLMTTKLKGTITSDLWILSLMFDTGKIFAGCSVRASNQISFHQNRLKYMVLYCIHNVKYKRITLRMNIYHSDMKSFITMKHRITTSHNMCYNTYFLFGFLFQGSLKCVAGDRITSDFDIRSGPPADFNPCSGITESSSEETVNGILIKKKKISSGPAGIACCIWTHAQTSAHGRSRVYKHIWSNLSTSMDGRRQTKFEILLFLVLRGVAF